MHAWVDHQSKLVCKPGRIRGGERYVNLEEPGRRGVCKPGRSRGGRRMVAYTCAGKVVDMFTYLEHGHQQT